MLPAKNGRDRVDSAAPWRKRHDPKSGPAAQRANLYPCELDVTFGEHELHLDVPEGRLEPDPARAAPGNKLLELDFTGDHVLELGTGCGIHAILLARQGAACLTLTEIAKPILENALHNLKKHRVGVPCDPIVAD